ncbi:hypothetical protein [Gimesia fumaroli]|jgi:hypothetical protein|uniref:Uncharacterized protein n=1 Tax=Gimesia fumaroli TaxID=2527976 RepID=A0A518IIU5_9PLAN|nr:hypothetical protein [Gimesia fumaroli]QDV53019.1 hypothetical protein Enr17x_50890 [Gimesia fumaroli]
MTNQPPQITPQQRLMMMTVIWLALIVGVVTFGVIIGFMGQEKAAGDDLPIITYLGIAMAALMLVLRTFVPNLVARNLFRQTMEKVKAEGNQDEEEILGTYYQIFTTRLIIGLALLEGAAMLNLVAILIENQKLPFVVVGILLLVMIASVPTKSKLDGWIRNQMENYNLEHQN